MIYSTLSRQTKRMTQFHDQNVQLLEIPRDMNECYTWYTQSSSSDIYSVISAGTISENSCFPQFERVAYEWTYESTDNISAYAVAIVSSVSIASQKSSWVAFIYPLPTTAWGGGGGRQNVSYLPTPPLFRYFQRRHIHTPLKHCTKSMLCSDENSFFFTPPSAAVHTPPPGSKGQPDLPYLPYPISISSYFHVRCPRNGNNHRQLIGTPG